MADVDTVNRHFLTVHKGLVVVQRPAHQLTPAHACEMAAWLVCMAELAASTAVDQEFDAENHFNEALKAVRNS